jgi:hypothetical protein
MTRDEIEDCKRQLQEQRRLGLEWVEATYRHQLRMLELVGRNASAEEGNPPAASPPLPEPARQAAPTPPPRRRRAGELYQEVLAVLPGLPDPFDVRDVRAALGYVPDRGSLFRVLQDLREQGHTGLHSYSAGSQPERYRKQPTGSGPA